MFTALVVMQLVEAGRVDLDATVATYLPGAPHASEITVRQLLSHTSGLPNPLDAAFSTQAVATPTTPEAVLAPLATQPLDFAPGTRYEYSNTNFVVLGRIAETLTGRPLAAIEAERILAPAGMTQSAFGAVPAGIPFATGYMDATGQTVAPPYDASWLYAAGDLITTAPDLARFDIALMAGKIVSLKSLAVMQTGLHDAGESGVEYGLGFMTATFGSQAIAGHHGGVPGFEADDEMITNAHFGVVVLGNSFGFATAAFNAVALSTLLPTDYALARTAGFERAANLRAAADPAIEAKLRGLLAGISANAIDRATLSPAMNAALTPSAVAAIAASFPPYGSLTKLAFLTHTTQGTYDAYVYAASYADGDVTYKLVLDASGKIAGFFRQ
jgi:CubicO group peptidase (beta-lactamase class C family)